MATSIAEHYMEELLDWNRVIVFYDQEASTTGTKLAEVIQRNCIPDIGAKVEKQQKRLHLVMKQFKRIRMQIKKQAATLKVDNTFIDDQLILPETEQKQNELRRMMQQTEQEYIDSKYACSTFLSETLKKRNE